MYKKLLYSSWDDSEGSGIFWLLFGHDDNWRMISLKQMVLFL